MKKFLFMAAALLMFVAPAANAQRVNTASELKKLDKADATLLDAKKNMYEYNAEFKAQLQKVKDDIFDTINKIDAELKALGL